jgi:quercetin dioxygenase-like cupin family protein
MMVDVVVFFVLSCFRGLICSEATMDHPAIVRPSEYATYSPARMGKSTIYESPRLLVGLNAFEAGQEHALHAHPGQDKVYHVIEGEGVFLLEGRELAMQAGDLLVAPGGVPHGVRNAGGGRLLVLAILAPAPQHS